MQPERLQSLSDTVPRSAVRGDSLSTAHPGPVGAVDGHHAPGHDLDAGLREPISRRRRPCPHCFICRFVRTSAECALPQAGSMRSPAL